MSHYLNGTAVLGALSPAEVENIELTQRAETRVVAGLLAGTVLATVGLAVGWKRHRVLGGLLGFFIVGPAVGTGAGLLLARGDIQKLRENYARQAAAGRGASRT